MTTQYVLFIVINNIKRFKAVRNKLISLDCNRFTAIDTYGSTELYTDMEFSRLMADTMGEQDSKKYNKTLMMVVESEEVCLKIMDEVQSVMNTEPNKPGGGIMFTIPIVKSHGVRF